jgi:hypothetical protein
VATLEARRSELLRQLAAVDVRLNAISKAVGAAAAKAPAAAKVAAKAPAAKKAVAKKGRPGGKGTVKRAWFEKQELPKLLRQVARSPKTSADLVRELAKAKGYDRSLSADDLRRFQGAAFMAVAQAIKTKMLKRLADGTVKLA